MKKRARALCWNIATLLGLALWPTLVTAQEGQLIDIVVHSPALEGNLLGDSPERDVTIYLPPGYNDNPEQRYPTVYLLHGYTSNNKLWTGSGYLGISIRLAADQLIAAGEIQPLIIVMPSADNAYWGSWYTNSPVTGNWEDFVVRDLVEHIDTQYRTLPQVSSRGIAGHSMGGYGAIFLAMKHPETFSAVYAMSAAALDMNEHIHIVPESGFPAGPTAFLTLARWDAWPGKSFTDWVAKAYVALAAAIAPNPNAAPFMADFPIVSVDGEPRVVDAVVQQWMQYDPLSMIATHGDNLSQYAGIRIDCGDVDDLISQNRSFSAALSAAGIEHIFTEYAGDHTNRAGARVKTEVLPFFSQTLSFETGSTAVGASSWGRVKTAVLTD